jgi:hypothetical protein
VERFPRWRVWWRAYYSTEATLGSLPVALVIPTLAALIGAAWAASHPSEVVRRGLVVHQASFGDALATALVGGVVGLVALVALVFAGTLAWYRLAGDRVWKAALELYYQERPSGVRTSYSSAMLQCTAVPPVNVSALGHVEAVVRLPTGRFLTMPQSGMRDGPDGIGFPPTGAGKPLPGVYEVRWYGTRQARRLQELARAKTTLNG